MRQDTVCPGHEKTQDTRQYQDNDQFLVRPLCRRYEDINGRPWPPLQNVEAVAAKVKAQCLRKAQQRAQRGKKREALATEELSNAQRISVVKI